MAAKAPASAAVPVEARQTVLIADDDEDQHYLMSRLLHRAGFKVAVVTRGASTSWQQAQATRPAVILLDVQMPDQDGFTTARQLKAHPETAGIPLMFLTGRSTVDDCLAGHRIRPMTTCRSGLSRELVLRVQKLCDFGPPPRGPAAAPRPPRRPRRPRADRRSPRPTDARG